VRHDLEHVSVKSAKAVIVLSPASGDRPQEADEADGFVLRVLLCLAQGLAVGPIAVGVAFVGTKD